MVDRMKDKVVVVAGAGSVGPGWGNGKAAAVLFAREGARVFCVDLAAEAAEETAAIIREEGGEATFDWDQFKAIIHSTTRSSKASPPTSASPRTAMTSTPSGPTETIATSALP